MSKSIQWVRCSERMPEGGKRVLGFSADWNHEIGQWWGSHWTLEWSDDRFPQAYITHWTPLPDRPQEEEVEGPEDRA